MPKLLAQEKNIQEFELKWSQYVNLDVRMCQPVTEAFQRSNRFLNQIEIKKLQREQ